MTDVRANPGLIKDPQVYGQYMKELTKDLPDDVISNFQGVLPNQIPQINRRANRMISVLSDKEKEPEQFTDFSIIPGTKLYGQKSTKTGKYVNIKDSIDGNTSLGSSEFERHLNNLRQNNLITEDYANKLIKQRAEGFAGFMKEGEVERLTEKQQDRYNRETKDLRKEYTQGSEHFRSMGITIDTALAAMDSGNTMLSETMLNQVMSQVQNTNVRAFQMYGEFNKEFGNLAERVQGKLSQFFRGHRTQRETEEIRNVLGNFNDNYVQPAETKLRDRYRQIAINQRKKPFDVVPPKNPEDIRGSEFLDNKEKTKMIKEYFPEWKPPEWKPQ